MFIPLRHLRPLRATLGALVGITGTALVSHTVVGGESKPWLVAPMGASAVLLFAVPASPLASPWNAFVGNLLSALVGVGCASWIPSPVFAAASAVALAVGVMGLCRCTHPPGGAVALTAVLGGPTIHSLGWSYVAVPIALNTTLLLGMAWLYGRVSGSPYPHRTPGTTTTTHRTSDPPPLHRTALPDASIDAVLDAQPDVLDVDRADLVDLLRQLSLANGTRRWATARCDAIMSRDVITANESDSVETAKRLVRRHGLNILPVVDAGGRPIGVLRPATLIDDTRNEARVAELVLTAPTVTSPAARVPHLLHLLLVQGAHEVLVVDDDGRLMGLVTAADVLPLTARATLPSLGRRSTRRRRRAH